LTNGHVLGQELGDGGHGLADLDMAAGFPPQTGQCRLELLHNTGIINIHGLSIV
jgi:hypothetical protein